MRGLVTLLAAALIAAPSLADVTVKSKVDSGGFKGMGAFSGTAVRMVADDKAREESDIDFKGRLMRAVTAARNGIEIVRIDLDKIWTLNPKRKTYTERSVSPPPQTREKDEEEEDEAPGEERGPDEEPTHRVKKSEFTVVKTGEKKTVNGFPTAENQIRLLIEIEEIATKEVTAYDFVTSVWAAPLTADLRKAAAEEKAFSQAYLKKMGFTPSVQRQLFDPRLLAMMLGVEPAKAEETLANTQRKMESIQGYPIVVDARWIVREDPKEIARRKEAARADETEDEGIDLSGGAAGAASSIFGGFAKKKMKERQEKKAAAREALPAFSSYHEVLSVSVAPVPASMFEVPAGYKKVSR